MSIIVKRRLFVIGMPITAGFAVALAFALARNSGNPAYPVPVMTPSHTLHPSPSLVPLPPVPAFQQNLRSFSRMEAVSF